VTRTTDGILVRLGRLVTYPRESYLEDVDATGEDLGRLDSELRAAFVPFGDAMRGLSTDQQQELYTRTFDLNPMCTLDLGWHLFGEQYERGAFMVRMRQALDRHCIVENGELPDHLSHLLQLAACLDPDAARALLDDALRPGLDKMLASLESADTPFKALLVTVRSVLLAHAAAAEEVHGA